MKAMILAAGYGTRLRPFSEHTPKTLFTIAGRPLLSIIISQLQTAGCEAIVINSHHLASEIQTFINTHHFAVPISISHEPQILGSGGGIKKASLFWDARPFMVVNGDIFFNIDLRAVYQFHLNHPHPVTMVLCDDPEFNTVALDAKHFITGFKHAESPHPQSKTLDYQPAKHLTFTGIQVVDPEILDCIAPNQFTNIIQVYTRLLSEGRKIKALVDKKSSWKDIGTPNRYKDTAYAQMASAAFEQAFGQKMSAKIKRRNIMGDGSDRRWYRLSAGDHTLIMVDHGIRSDRSICEVDSFVAIGRHLYLQGVAVPRISLYDTFCGLVFLEDLGDEHLQTRISRTSDQGEIIACYENVIDNALKMWRLGAEGFNTAWTYQSTHYDIELIMQKECRYFVDAFLNECLKLQITFDELADEFSTLAAQALKFAATGFMHRDLQSRNIMMHNDQPFFIDFQGGRLGALQYDLAALLIDPYVALSNAVQRELRDYGINALATATGLDSGRLLQGYKYCCLTRNLQILGAFGFLSKIKGKTYFKTYIPTALKTLKTNLASLRSEFPRLAKLVTGINF